jgi:hypothetical protein
MGRRDLVSDNLLKGTGKREESKWWCVFPHFPALCNLDSVREQDLEFERAWPSEEIYIFSPPTEIAESFYLPAVTFPNPINSLSTSRRTPRVGDFRY